MLCFEDLSLSGLETFVPHTNSIYRPRMSVIGRYWTTTNEHDGWKVYWKVAVLEPLSMVCKLAANEMSAGISRLNIFITVTVGCANYFLLTFE